MISIIVPVYNAAGTLAACVESLTAQTYKDIEIILVDDGSPDKSGELCDLLAEKDSRIKVIHKENGGVSSARNTGIETASGEYILFCDSDDVVEPSWCLELLGCAESYPEYIPMCGIRKLWKDGTEKLIILPEDCNRCEKITEEKYLLFDGEGLLYLAENWLLNCPTNKLYKRDILIEKGLRFDLGISNGEDADFNFRYIASTSGKFAFVNNPLYVYLYYSENSLSHNEPLYGAKNSAMHCNGFFAMIEKLGITDSKFVTSCEDFYFNVFVMAMKRCVADKKISFREKVRIVSEITSMPEYEKCRMGMNQNLKIAKIARHKMVFVYYIVFRG